LRRGFFRTLMRGTVMCRATMSTCPKSCPTFIEIKHFN
jgi:hypothetical protein